MRKQVDVLHVCYLTVVIFVTTAIKNGHKVKVSPIEKQVHVSYYTCRATFIPSYFCLELVSSSNVYYVRGDQDRDLLYSLHYCIRSWYADVQNKFKRNC